MPIWLIILLAILIVIIGVGTYIYQQETIYKKPCHKCNRQIGGVDNYYYIKKFNSSTRYRCALHPLKGYDKRYIKSKHYKVEVSRLSQEQKNELETNKKLVLVMQDFGFGKIYKVFNQYEKTTYLKLDINNTQLTVNDKKSGIYLITNITTGRKYVGQSINILNRWSQHNNDIKDDGFHNEIMQSPHSFKYKVLINCPKEYLDFFEAYYIAEHDSYNNGYNLTKGNYSHLEEYQHKILNSMK